MRTLEEIAADCLKAFTHHNAEALLKYAEEYEAFGTRFAAAEALLNRGRAATCIGSLDDALAHYRAALLVYEELGDLSHVGTIHRDIGHVLSSIGNSTAALEHYHQSLENYEQAGLRVGVAGMLGNLGNVHKDLGDLPKSMEFYRRALALATELDKQDQIAKWTGAIAGIYRSMGEYPQSVLHYMRSIEISEALGETQVVALMNGNLGNVFGEVGDLDEALVHYQKSLLLYTELNDQRGIANVSVRIGNNYRIVGDATSAMEYWKRARSIYSEYGDRPGIINATACIAGFLLQSNDVDAARELIDSANIASIELPAYRIQWETLLARQHEAEGNPDLALATYQSALDEAMAHGMRQYELNLYEHLRNFSQRANDFASYIKYNDSYNQLKEEIAGKDASVRIAMIQKEREIETMEVERERERAVLYSTLPKHIAERVIRGEQVNDLFEHAAVMFLDIVGFTSLSSQLSSTNVVQMLESVFDICDRSCANHNVTKIKTIGDSYMAVAFPDQVGTSRDLEHDHMGKEIAKQLALAALDILDAIESLELNVRIGLHYGPVTAGVLGKDRLQYDVWGDTVNVASRLESTCEPGRIHVSTAFAEAMSSEQLPGRSHTLVPRGEIEIKGRGHLFTYWLER